jgi:hypothetical protein
VQRHSDSPDDRAHDLTTAGLGVQYPPGRDRAHDARNTDDAKLLVHLNLGEDSRVRIARMRFVFREVIEFLLLDPLEVPVSHGIRDRNCAILSAIAGDRSVDKDDIGHIGIRERRTGHRFGETS